MTIQLSGKPTSYWVDSTPETTHPQLDRDLMRVTDRLGGPFTPPGLVDASLRIENWNVLPVGTGPPSSVLLTWMPYRSMRYSCLKVSPSAPVRPM